MKNLSQVDLKNKTVLVRSDFNVPVDDNGKVIDAIRITESIETIKYLTDKKAKVILISHIGDPKIKKSFEKKEDNNFSKLEISESLYPVYKELQKEFPQIIFSDDCLSVETKEKAKNLKAGEVLLLENLRMYGDEKEKGELFSKELAKMADIYINNAFSVAHRDHASISGVPQYIPSYPGLLFQKEVEVLTMLRDDIKRPFVVIIGGAKIESKAKTIKCFTGSADFIILGGKVANTLLFSKGLIPEEVTEEKDIGEKIKELDLDSEKLYLPVDLIAYQEKDNSKRVVKVSEIKKDEKSFDIGPETIKIYAEIIKKAKTIIWAGPIGFYEKEGFEEGTKKIAEAIAENRNALKVIGGGDTGAALKYFNLRDKIDHASLGGGALLSFLSKEPMYGIEALS